MNPNRFIRAFCLGGLVFWGYILATKFINFGYYDWDLAIYSQAMWHLVHGSFQPTLFGMNFFGNHAEYISFLIAPLYAIFPHPMTLVIINLTGFFTTVYILYFVFRHFIPCWAAVLLCMAYVLYPPNVFMLLYEFHFESLALPFLAAMLLYYLKQRLVPFIVVGGLACLCKENIPLILVMFGVLSFFRPGMQQKKWGLLPILGGLLYFFGVMFVIIPFIRRGMATSGSIFWALFSGLGSSPGEILCNAVLHPSLVFHLIWTPENVRWLNALFAPFLYFSIGAPGMLLLIVPIFLQNMFSATGTMHTIFFHYTATMAPFIACAAAITLGKLAEVVRPRSVFVLAAMLLVSCGLSLWSWRETLMPRVSLVRDSLDDTRAAMVNRIPDNAAVITTFDFLSHLSSRREVYAFYNVWLGKNLLTQQPFVVPARVSYGLIDLNDPWLKAARAQDPAGVDARVQAFLDDGWRLMAKADGILLLHRQKGSP